jgi:hypothetical protein
MLSLLGSLRRGNFVQRSLRFRSSASANLSRTFGTPTNNNVWTYSGWIKRGQLTATQTLLSVYIDASNYSVLSIRSDDKLEFSHVNSGVTYAQATSLAVFRDPSAYMHIVITGNREEAVDANRIKMYVNGVQITSWTVTPTWNAAQNVYLNQNRVHSIGRFNTLYLDGYLTEVNFIDGQALAASSFGQIESTTGVWSPKQYAGSYGTNGFYLKFGNTSSVAALGNDSSGNGNTWTVNNVSLTAGVTYDSMIDVPVNYSDGGNGRGNYAVLNPLIYDSLARTVSTGGNLGFTLGDLSNGRLIWSTIPMSSGKWYAEFTLNTVNGNGQFCGIIPEANALTLRNTGNTYTGAQSGEYAYGRLFATYATAAKYISGTLTNNNTTLPVAGDIIGLAYDADNNTLSVYLNNTLQTVTGFTPASGTYYFSVSGAASTWVANFGQRPFQNTTAWATLQASGFKALNTNNLPTPSIVNGANFMAATTYTGNAAARSLSNAVNNVSFQPDLVWIKSRTPGATNHALFDSSRGVTKYLSSNTTTAETTLAQSLTALNADGFSLGTDTTLVNASANSYIAWQWRESITAGLDIVTYTGNGANRTIAHNLGVAPAMVIVKRYDAPNTGNWQVRHRSIAATDSIQLNATSAAAAAATVWNSTAPTSSVFSVGTSTDVNATGGTYAAYCFAEIAGFSKIGSYTGNGSADGPFVFCGFRPRWVMYKSTTETTGWAIIDTSSNTSNVADKYLNPNDSTVEGTSNLIDVISNGFKFRTIASGNNASGQTYIFAAFAEVPSKYALAR